MVCIYLPLTQRRQESKYMVSIEDNVYAMLAMSSKFDNELAN